MELVFKDDPDASPFKTKQTVGFRRVYIGTDDTEERSIISRVPNRLKRESVCP